VAQGIEAIVLMEDDGADATDQEVFVGRIGQRVPVVAAVADDALVKLGVGVAVLGETGLDAGDEEGRVVKAVFDRKSELCFWCLGRQLRIGGDGAEVGHDA